MYQSHTEKEVIEPATEATRVRCLPAWAGKRRNLLGLVPFSRCHYFGVVAINDSVIEALLDTGGAVMFVSELNLNSTPNMVCTVLSRC